ncbi:MAG: hypothetical protein ACREQV_19130, partial [Candidatus Binatia bacterium]
MRIDVGTLSGSGSIAANGGAATQGGGSGGGGGGRVAIYYQNAAAFNFATQVTAIGGIGVIAPNGGAGTVYLQGPGTEAGELVIDNNNIGSATLSTPIPHPATGTIALMSLRVKRGAKVRLDTLLNIASVLEVTTGSEFISTNRTIAGTINLTGNALITHLPTSATTSFKVDLSANAINIDASSRIDVTGLGFLGGVQPGNPFGLSGMTVGFAVGSASRGGGSYGGLGGIGAGAVNPVYGDFRNPNEAGSGGGSVSGPAGNGGGLIRIVAQTLALDGVIRANGSVSQVFGAGGSGGGMRIDVGTLSGSGSIAANGGAATQGGGSGGGGGGRIAIYYQNAAAFNFATQVTAIGGIGVIAPNGGAGTVYLQGPGTEAGELVIDNNNIGSATLSTPVPNPAAGTIALTNLRVKRSARIRLDSVVNLTSTLEIGNSSEFISTTRTNAGTINLSDNSVITHLPTTATTSFKVDLSANAINIDASSRIDVTGLGF